MRKEYIVSIIGSGRELNEEYKPSQKNITNEIRSETGEIITNREEVIKVCACLYQDT